MIAVLVGAQRLPSADPLPQVEDTEAETTGTGPREAIPDDVDRRGDDGRMEWGIR